MKTTCLIAQADGIGDILFCRKIAYDLAESGYRVIWPIKEQLSWLRYHMRPIPNVEYPVVRKRTDEWEGTFDHSDLYFKLLGASWDHDNPVFNRPIKVGDDLIFVALWASEARTGAPLMPSKYQMLDMDFRDWTDFVSLKRRPYAEAELFYDVLGLRDHDKYTLVNGTCSSGTIRFAAPGKTVELEEIAGFSLIDWSMVIEKARQIVTIDTSLVLLVELLKIRQPLYMFSRYSPPSFEQVKDILSLDWNMAPYPGNLSIVPAEEL